jgi:hypothetical protein
VTWPYELDATYREIPTGRQVQRWISVDAEAPVRVVWTGVEGVFPFPFQRKVPAGAGTFMIQHGTANITKKSFVIDGVVIGTHEFEENPSSETVRRAFALFNDALLKAVQPDVKALVEQQKKASGPGLVNAAGMPVA